MDHDRGVAREDLLALDSVVSAPAIRGTFPGTPWEPVQAWRLRALYGPITHILRSIAAAAGDGPGSSKRLRVLQVGGHPQALRCFLAAESARLSPHDAAVAGWEVLTAAAMDVPLLPVPNGAVDVAIAIDWLSCLAPSRREAAVAALARAARHAVVIANAFAGPEVVAAARAVNELHRALTGTDHPSLGRAMELGFPDAGAVRGWLQCSFPIVNSIALESTSNWQLGEAIAVAHGAADRTPSESDVAAATLYPGTAAPSGDGPGFHTLMIASGTQTAIGLAPLEPTAVSSELAALGIHHAIEAAAQRRALDRLVDAVTVERDREREEFRSTLASLAAEVRDLDGRAEWLSREVRARDERIANQQLAIDAEGERSAALSRELAACSERLGASEARVAAVEARLAVAEPAADALRLFLDSRAGRLLRSYTRLKNFFLRRR